LPIEDGAAGIAAIGWTSVHFSRQSWSSTRGPGPALPSGVNRKALELQQRTQTFAAQVIKFCEALPNGPVCREIVKQLTDAAGAADSNYRATCRARSPDEFIAKVGVAGEEADESKGWLELLVKSGFAKEESARALIQEADELTAIFVASRKTAERRKEERENLKKQLLASRRSRRRK
jgi:four helix bundle protein